MHLTLPRLFCILAVCAGTVFSLKGGAVYKPEDFPYAALVQNADRKSGCIGIIDSATSIVTSAKCLNKTQNQIVAPISDPQKTVPIIEVLHHEQRHDAAKDAGLAEFPEVGKFPLFGMVIGKAADPGLSSAAFAPKPDADVIKKDTVGIIIGTDKAASMKLLSDEDCLKAIKSRPELYAKLTERRVVKKDIFCAVKADVGDKYPPGYPCESDAGAPIVIKQSVGGLLLGASCDSDKNHTAIFSSFGTNPWEIRRFEDPPPETPGPAGDTTAKPADGGADTTVPTTGIATKSNIGTTLVICAIAIHGVSVVIK